MSAFNLSRTMSLGHQECFSIAIRSTDVKIQGEVRPIAQGSCVFIDARSILELASYSLSRGVGKRMRCFQFVVTMAK